MNHVREEGRYWSFPAMVAWILIEVTSYVPSPEDVVVYMHESPVPNLGAALFIPATSSLSSLSSSCWFSFCVRDFLLLR